MDLALGRARADRAPGDGVGDVLRRDRVEELAADRQSQREHLEQQLARGAQARVDVAGAVEVRVVDQALPAGRRARLLEVHAHRHDEVGTELGRLQAEPAGVLERRSRVVDAARPDDDEQAVVGALQDRVGVGAPLHDDLGELGAQRQALDQAGGRRQRRDPLDAAVADARCELGGGHGDHLDPSRLQTSPCDLGDRLDSTGEGARSPRRASPAARRRSPSRDRGAARRRCRRLRRRRPPAPAARRGRGGRRHGSGRRRPAGG